MKLLTVLSKELQRAGRWDIDFHLPPTEIKRFPSEVVISVWECADIIKTKRDPTKKPEEIFQYVDIASVDVESGVIVRPQELTGEEAPSRARKVIHAYDIIISNCRPTRGAIAVIPEELHGQICSTGFSVIRAKKGINPFYLHYALRLPSTLEQFRKWSTGSSYPAILDEDVSKTKIPMPERAVQDAISGILRGATREREQAIQAANDAWKRSIESVTGALCEGKEVRMHVVKNHFVYSVEEIEQRLAALAPVNEEPISDEEELLAQSLFEEEE